MTIILQFDEQKKKKKKKIGKCTNEVSEGTLIRLKGFIVKEKISPFIVIGKGKRSEKARKSKLMLE